jgi:hypothetical protein
MPARIDDALLDAIAPAAPYAEIAAVLRGGVGALCAGLTFPMPADPAHDGAARAAIEALRA